jgi:hypothetical protein
MTYLSSSDEVEDQVVDALSCAVDEALAMLKVQMEGPSTRRSTGLD